LRHSVAEERSFTKAAKHLNVSQSALSHAIRGAGRGDRCPAARANDAQRGAD
jgi:hypothetical protein